MILLTKVTKVQSDKKKIFGSTYCYSEKYAYLCSRFGPKALAPARRTMTNKTKHIPQLTLNNAVRNRFHFNSRFV